MQITSPKHAVTAQNAWQQRYLNRGRVLRLRPVGQPRCLKIQNTAVNEVVGLQSTDLTTVIEESPHTEQHEETKVYNWKRQWYPLAVEKDLDTTRPHPVMLFGKHLVLWKDGFGEWRCFEDLCPHRKAPLSEGRIEPSDNTLMCVYHGWRFDGNGLPVTIPQAKFDGIKVEETACRSKRSHVVTFPTMVVQGAIWVWGESGPDAFVHSSMKRPVIADLAEGHNKDEVLVLVDGYSRDVPGSFDAWIENSADQSHVPFAHHGVPVGGLRDSPWSNHIAISNVNKELQGDDGFTMDMEWSPTCRKPPQLQKVFYAPPVLLGLQLMLQNGGYSLLWFHLVPIAPDRTRLIHWAIVKLPKPSWIAATIARLVPRWLGHVLLSTVIDGDIPFVSKQSISFNQRMSAGRKWAKEYYTPAQSDRGMLEFRRWFHGKAGGGPDWDPETKADSYKMETPREILLDRLNSHTKNCKACSKALENFLLAKKILDALAVTALFAATAVFRSAPSANGIPWASVSWVVAAAVMWGIGQAIQKFTRRFTYTGYDHATA